MLSGLQLTQDDAEKTVKILFHILKECYKKSYVKGSVDISKCMADYLGHVTTNFKSDVKKLFFTSHQMCYSLYTKSLQNKVDVIKSASDELVLLFELRINSLLVLSFSDLEECKFKEHMIDFISRWTKILIQSQCTKIDILLLNLKDLLNRLHALVKVHCQVNNDESLTMLTWKVIYFYIRLVARYNRHECYDPLLTIYSDSKVYPLSSVNDVEALQCTYEINTLINKSSEKCFCICKKKESLVQILPDRIAKCLNKKYINLDRLLDIITLIKIPPDVVLCATIINSLIKTFSCVFSSPSFLTAMTKLSKEDAEKKMKTLLFLVNSGMQQLYIIMIQYKEKEDTACFNRDLKLR